MGGRLTVESTTDKGSCFTLHWMLPATTTAAGRTAE
jgi:signal transduction histidine kinase